MGWEKTGNIICMIPLELEYQDKMISVTFCNPFGREQILVPKRYLTTRDKMALSVWNKEKSRIIACTLAMVIGIVLLIMGIILQFQEQLQVGGVFYAGLFMILSSMWLYTDSELPLLNFYNVKVVCLLSFLLFFVLPLPLLRFLEGIGKRKSIYFSWSRGLLVLNCLVQSLLYVTGISSFPKMLPITHFLYGFTMVGILFYRCILINGNRK